MIILKGPAELDRLRASCRIAAAVRDEVSRMVAPGVATAELDKCAAEMIRKHGATSAFLGYRGYPGHICLSVNEVVVHGVPGGRRIEVGDIVGIDVGVRYNGYVGDTATTVSVGVSDMGVIRLVEVTRNALAAGIAQAQVGNKLSDISHAIESVAVAAGFSVVRDFVGHGIGRELHEDPQIPNFGAAGHGPELKDGMTFALEPMVNMGKSAVEIMNDGWTVRTKDGKPSAHFEHSIAIRKGMSAEILTTGCA